MNILLIIFLGLSFLYQSYSQAVVIGSETAVSIMTTATVFPAADTDNMMLGFGWFKGGFILEDATTSCTFNSVFPVSGIVNMNGGTLYLEQDVELANPTELEGLGAIIGNGHSIEFAENIEELPANLTLIKDVNIFFNGDVELSCTLTIQGHCTINGGGNTMELEDDVRVIIDSGATLKWQDMRIEALKNDNAVLVDDTSHLVLSNVVICLMGDMHIEHGDILFQSKVTVFGNHTFWYDSAQPCMIGDEATLFVDGGIVFKIGKKTADGVDPLIFYDDGSIFSCGWATLMVGEHGIVLKRGKVELNSKVIIDVASTDTMKGIILGDGVSEENDVLLFLGPGSYTQCTAGAITYNNVASDKFYSAAPSARFLRKNASTFHMATTCIFPTCVLEFEFDGVHFPPTTLAANVKLYYDNTRVIIPNLGDATFNARREGIYSFVLDTYDKIYFSSGAFPGNILIAGPGNRMCGNGSVFGSLAFVDSSANLSVGLLGALLSSVSLNGGMLTLVNDIVVTQANCFTSAGLIDLSKYTMDFYYLATEDLPSYSFDCAMTWSGNNGRISISDDTSLVTTWTFMGVCTIEGEGNTLSLLDGGKLIVGSGAQLILKDIRLDVVDSRDIACIDDTGTVVLDNVHWVQHSNCAFDTGALVFKHNVKLSGENYVFTYRSTQTSRIEHDANLIFDYHFTFSYDPVNASSDLFVFTDVSSQLQINNSTLYIVPGLKLTKGQIFIQQNPMIYAFGEGLTLGDQVSGHDMDLVFMDNQSVNIAAGALNYRNVDEGGLQMWSGSCIGIGEGATLRIYEDMVLGAGAVTMYQDSVLAYALGKSIVGPINSAGEFTRIDL